MSCCGQKRLALVTGTARGHGRQPVDATDPARRFSEPVEGQLLRYLGPARFSTRSIVTGRAYACAGTGDLVRVDARDIGLLIRTGLFRRV